MIFRPFADVTRDQLQLFLAYHWPHGGLRVKTVADTYVGHVRRQAVPQLIRLGFLHDDPAERGATLATAQESRCYDLSCRAVQIVALDNDCGVFSTKFQLDLSHAAGHFFSDANAYGGGTGETDCTHPSIGNQLFPTLAGTDHQIENAGWKAGLLK